MTRGETLRELPGTARLSGILQLIDRLPDSEGVVGIALEDGEDRGALRLWVLLKSKRPEEARPSRVRPRFAPALDTRSTAAVMSASGPPASSLTRSTVTASMSTAFQVWSSRIGSSSGIARAFWKASSNCFSCAATSGTSSGGVWATPGDQEPKNATSKRTPRERDFKLRPWGQRLAMMCLLSDRLTQGTFEQLQQAVRVAPEGMEMPSLRAIMLWLVRFVGRRKGGRLVRNSKATDVFED